MMYDEDLQGLKEISQFLPCSIASSFLGQTTGWDKPFDNNNNCDSWDRMTPYPPTNYHPHPHPHPHNIVNNVINNQAYTLDYMEMDLGSFLEENEIKNSSLNTFRSGSNEMYDLHNSNNVSSQRCASLCSSNPSTPRSDMPSPSSPGLSSPSSPESACYSIDYQHDFAPFIIKAGPESSYLSPCKWSSPSAEHKSTALSRKAKKQTFVPEDLKDSRYWSRRRKNNLAAKRSRDARRIKETQIAVHANFLQAQNNKLLEECEKLRVENMRLKQKLMKFDIV